MLNSNHMFKQIKDILKFRALKRTFNQHERLLVPLMLLVGVVIDFITFRTIETTTAFLILGIYTLVAGVMITIIHRYDAAQSLLERPTTIVYIRLAAPLVTQLTFGALLSAAFIFYWFSGSFTVSWPLLIIVIGLMAANDVFREHYLRPTVQLSVYYFTLFITLAVALPYLFESISPWVFVAAGVSSLILMLIFLRALTRIRPDLRFMHPSPTISIMIIFLVMNAGYFLNIIPPIPLSLTDAGVYHSVERQGNNYLVSSEEQSWFDRFLPGETINIAPGDRLYAYASIFAPVDLDTTVTHHWQRLTDDGWENMSSLSYSIKGGRQDGYRGYSYLTSPSPGKWRVDVETERGQVIGRISFQINEVDEAIILVEELK